MKILMKTRRERNLIQKALRRNPTKVSRPMTSLHREADKRRLTVRNWDIYEGD